LLDWRPWHEEKAHQDEEIEVYTKILDSTPVYIPRPHYREILSVEVQTSKDGKRAILEVELKPFPSHLIYGLLSLDQTVFIIVCAKLDGPKLEQLLDVHKKYKVP